MRSAIERVFEARQGLLEWYDANHRVLPWRRNVHLRHCEPTDAVGEKGKMTDDPNADSIGGCMLDLYVFVGAAADRPRPVRDGVVGFRDHVAADADRTRRDVLATVDGEGLTVRALANATQEEVNEPGGLGHHRRRFLLEGARHILASSDDRDDPSRFPSTFKALVFPASAVHRRRGGASIAFEEPVAAVDGNDPRRGAARRRARRRRSRQAGPAPRGRVLPRANAMLAREDPGLQSGHDGARRDGVRAQEPQVLGVPVAAHCVGLELQTASVGMKQNDALTTETFDVDSIPVKEKKAPKREETVSCMLRGGWWRRQRATRRATRRVPRSKKRNTSGTC